MKKYVALALLLVVPLIVLVVVAICAYGLDGPPDNDAVANFRARMAGQTYVFYVMLVLIIWSVAVFSPKQPKT